jgi:hypothetical protein
VDPNFIVEMSHIQAMGDEKHAHSHWTNGVPVSEIVDAIKRHTAQIEIGEYLDPDTGIPHSTHIANNCMYLSYYLRNMEVYRPFFDLPFAVGNRGMADTRVPGKIAPGRVGEILGRSGGIVQDTKITGRVGRPHDLAPGSVPHGGSGPDRSDMAQAGGQQE